MAVNASSGDVYVADASQARVDVFEPEHPGKPIVAGLSAENLTPTSVRLSAQINPDGTEAHYFFQYGTANCVLTPSACKISRPRPEPRSRQASGRKRCPSSRGTWRPRQPTSTA